jgi:hypothetical protein
LSLVTCGRTLALGFSVFHDRGASMDSDEAFELVKALGEAYRAIERLERELVAARLQHETPTKPDPAVPAHCAAQSPLMRPPYQSEPVAFSHYADAVLWLS